MLEITHLNKSFTLGGTKRVLDEFDLSMRPGEFVSLIGPSGCGKTTALRIVAGLLEQSSGTVTIDGKVSTGPSRDKAIVFQHFNLLPWRSAIDNVAYGLELQGMPKARRMQIAAQYLELVGLTESAHKYPSQLSGGMRQRIGIARALAIDPKLLLMDEPFGALDAHTRTGLQNDLLHIWDKDRKTVLFVTHSVEEAVFLSDRVVMMSSAPGRIKHIFDIDLPRPRSRAELLLDRRFQDYVVEIEKMFDDTAQQAPA